MSKVLIISERDLTADLGHTILWAPEVERVLTSTATAACGVAPALVPSLVVLEASDAATTRGVLRLLRDAPGTRRSSIVVVTRSEVLTAEEAQEAGANLLLKLPIADGLDTTLRQLLLVARRVRARFPVRLAPREDAPDAEWIEGEAIDLSMAGMLLETKAGPVNGDTIHVRLTPPGAREDLRLAARVVRSTSGPTQSWLAVRFVSFQDRAQERIRVLLDALSPDLSFGRYEVTGLIAEGSMGRVYRGFDPMANRAVAIKTLKPEPPDGTSIEEYLSRFRREAQSAARLVHPNIITLFDVGSEYFVMEILEGQTLQRVLHERGHLDPEELLYLLGPIADALDYAHEQGVIHRDIKPANIMVLPDGRPKVMDFGVAHLTSAIITGRGQVFGSPGYMAPEQVAQGHTTRATDLFSLASVAYEALTGRRPFEGKNVPALLYNVVHTDPPTLTSLRVTLPQGIDAVFTKAMAKDPAERFPSARAFVYALGQATTQPALAPALAGASSGEHPAPGVDPLIETTDLRRLPRRWPRLGRRLLPGTLVAGGVLAGGGWLLSVPHSPSGSTVLVATEPPGAAVFIDGTLAGQSPVTVPGVAPGHHVVRALRSGFSPAEMSLETTGRDARTPLRFALKSLNATLEIASEPSGAAVRLDGQDSGATPVAALEVAPGSHELRVEQPGYRPWTQQFTAPSGQSLRFTAHLSRTSRGTMKSDGWLRHGDLVELSAGVSEPRRLSAPDIPYPESARKLNLAGRVTVEFTVTETGEVVDPFIVESAGDILDQAVLDAVRTWRYAAAEKNGVRVRVRIREAKLFGTGKG